MRVKSGIQRNFHIPVAQHGAWPKVDLRTASGQREGHVHKLLVCSHVRCICKGYIGIVSMRIKGILFTYEKGMSKMELNKRLCSLSFGVFQP